MTVDVAPEQPRIYSKQVATTKRNFTYKTVPFFNLRSLQPLKDCLTFENIFLLTYHTLKSCNQENNVFRG